MQVVVCGNRILAHGDNDFAVMSNGNVTGKNGEVYKNATIVECDALPEDVKSVGYELHLGEFIPCAPFGIGEGNVVVACDENCKALKDSGTPFNTVLKMALLWSNASTSSDFSAQTVTLASSDWVFLIVIADDGSTIVSKGTSSVLQCENTSGNESNKYSRTVSATATKVTFGAAYRSYLKASSTTISFNDVDNALIPHKIYGVRL